MNKNYKTEIYKLSDRDVPVKPKLGGRYCGKCGIVRLIPSYNYCHICGQKIDWGNKNE